MSKILEKQQSYEILQNGNQRQKHSESGFLSVNNNKQSTSNDEHSQNIKSIGTNNNNTSFEGKILAPY